jgi:hypothetical protein
MPTRNGARRRGGDAAAVTRELQVLATALDEEAALAESLCEALVRLRSSIATAEAEPVARSVEGIGCELLALQEARHRRGRMLADLAGDTAFPLSDLSGELEVPPPPALTAARARLRTAAEGVLREASINRSVLRRAIEHGDRYLQTLFSTASGTTPAYGPAERASSRGPQPSVLVNRRA